MAEPASSRAPASGAALPGRESDGYTVRIPMDGGGAPMASSKEDPRDRLFNPHGLRHFRRQHSPSELRWGLAIAAVLLAIAGWVAYRGAHPDPGLFADGKELLKKTPGRVAKTPTPSPTPTPMPRSPSPVTKTPTRAPAPSSEADKLLPAELGDATWEKKPTKRFTKESLYEKINGRADYFVALGFKQLLATTLQHRTLPQHTIDVELYDQANSSNALGVYSGELGAKVRPVVGPLGMHHLARNALFICRGRYYLRLIGSDESRVVTGKLEQLRGLFEKRIEGVPLPWGFAFFISQLAVKAKAISYVRVNAFSFDFARDVYTARTAGDGFLFVTAQNSPGDAKTLAAKFVTGFLSYGAKEAAPGTAIWVKDRYINTYSTALAIERWVVGVQGMPDLATAQRELARLSKAIGSMGEALKSRARPRKDAPRRNSRRRPR